MLHSRERIPTTRNRRDAGAAGAALVAGVVLLVAAGAGLWWFLSDDAPATVDLDVAAGVVSTTSETADAADPSAASTDTTAAVTQKDPRTGVDGTWKIDDSIGAFSFENATSSFVGFRIQEELVSIGTAEAVGRTPAVSGTLEIEGTSLVAATIEADFTRLVTNDSRRDGRAKGALETDKFPTAAFVLSEPVDFGTIPGPEDTISVTAVGDLTIHGVSRRVDFPLHARLVDDVIVVVGSTEVVFADYGVETPSAVVVVSVEDHGVVEVQLFFTRV